jgi:hypothetical protein
MILLSAGLGIGVIGVKIQLAHEIKRYGGFELNFTGTFIAVGGGLVLLSSTPCLINSSKNKKKAATVSIANQNIFLPKEKGWVSITQPAVTFRIGL